MNRRNLWSRISTDRTLTIVASVLGFFIVVGILACAGLFFWGVQAFSRDMADAEESANHFFEEIRAGQIDAAYGTTTRGFQADQPLNEFRAFVKQNPVLKTYTSQKTGLVTRRGRYQVRLGPTVTVRTTLTSPGNSKSFTLRMKKENHRWKVEKIYVPRL